MHEAQSRPSGENLGEFVWRRGLEYFELEEISRLPDCRKDDNLAGDFLKALRKIHRELKGL